jgi:hypothetical protein
MLSVGVHNIRSEWGMCGFPHGDLDAFEPTYDDKLNGGDGPLKRDEVGREGIEPSWVAPGDFKSPASTVSPPPHTGSVALCA